MSTPEVDLTFRWHLCFWRSQDMLKVTLPKCKRVLGGALEPPEWRETFKLGNRPHKVAEFQLKRRSPQDGPLAIISRGPLIVLISAEETPVTHLQRHLLGLFHSIYNL